MSTSGDAERARAVGAGPEDARASDPGAVRGVAAVLDQVVAVDVLPRLLRHRFDARAASPSFDAAALPIETSTRRDRFGGRAVYRPLDRAVDRAAVGASDARMATMRRLSCGAARVALDGPGGALAERVLRSGTSEAWGDIRRRLIQGVAPERIELGLLAAAARALGAAWVRDELSFVDVTVGLAHLHELLGRVHAADPARLSRSARSILLAPVPGETHRFGAAMAAGVFRRAGWDTTLLHFDGAAALAERAADDAFDVVGLSVAADQAAPAARAAIAALRRAAPRTPILLGGALIAARPRLGVQIGADAGAPNATVALDVAARLAAARLAASRA